MRSFMSSSPHQILFGCSNQEDWDERGTWHVWERPEVHTEFWWGNLRKRDHLEDVAMYGRIILKWIIKKWDGGMYRIHLAPDRDR
jgi:hypothetical protein